MSKQAAATASQEKDPQLLLKGDIERYKPAIGAVLPKSKVDQLDRIVKVVLSATARNEKLLQCSRPSIIRCIMQAAELGLEIGGLMGEAYLVPFKRSWQEGGQWRSQLEAQCIIGYKGLIKLARQSGQIRKIVARVVYANDVAEGFSVDLANDTIHHVITGFSSDRGPIVGVYAIATFNDGTQQLEAMSYDDVVLIQKRSKAGNEGPWVTDFPEMARKTVVRRLCKYLPLSVEAIDALAHDDSIDAGGEGLAISPELAAAMAMADKKPATLADRIRNTARAVGDVVDVPADDKPSEDMVAAERDGAKSDDPNKGP